MDQQTIDTYNNLAKEYDDETIDFWNQFPRTFIKAFAEASGKEILDVGSGPGRDGVLLLESGKAVTCVDASEAMVRLSSERGLKTILADFNHLPFSDETFDGAWAYTSLLHVPKASVGSALEEIRRVLKPGGILALGLIEGGNEEYKESSGVGMPRWFSLYQKDEALALCKECGFELVHFETFKPRSKTYLNFIFHKK